jgi:hypothetical protein
MLYFGLRILSDSEIKWSVSEGQHDRVLKISLNYFRLCL